MAATDYDFQLTRNEIIALALSRVGAIGVGDSISAEMFETARLELNAMVKSWQNDHIFLWTLRELTVTLADGTASYALDDDPAVVAIDRGYFVDDGDDISLEQISIREYQDIPDKDDEGDPVQFAVDGASAPTVYLWPTPDAVGTFKYVGICKLKDWDSASGSGDFTSRWMDALTAGLTVKLAPHFGVPFKEREALKREAVFEFGKAKRGDRSRADSEHVRPAYGRRR